MACDQFHLFAKTIQFADSSVNIRRDAKALKLFVHDGRDEDVVFGEQIFADGLRAYPFDLDVRDGARLIGIEGSVELDFGHILEPVHPVT